MRQLPLPLFTTAYEPVQCGKSRSYRIREVATGNFAFGLGQLIFVSPDTRWHNSYPLQAAWEVIRQLEQDTETPDAE